MPLTETLRPLAEHPLERRAPIPAQPLPVISLARTEFGFARTECACQACTRCCHHIPGYLIPADLDRIVSQTTPGADLSSWAHQHLLASPGA
jgi:hypothetical protein